MTNGCHLPFGKFGDSPGAALEALAVRWRAEAELRPSRVRQFANLRISSSCRRGNRSCRKPVRSSRRQQRSREPREKERSWESPLSFKFALDCAGPFVPELEGFCEQMKYLILIPISYVFLCFSIENACSQIGFCRHDAIGCFILGHCEF